MNSLREVWEAGYQTNRLSRPGPDMTDQRLTFAVVAPDQKTLGYASTTQEVIRLVRQHLAQSTLHETLNE